MLTKLRNPNTYDCVRLSPLVCWVIMSKRMET